MKTHDKFSISRRQMPPRLRTRAPTSAQIQAPPPVVWAVDAFSNDFEGHARTAAALHAHRPESEIHPVYVLSEEVFSSRGYSSFLRAALKPRAHHNLMSILDHELLLPIRKTSLIQTPRVLVERSADASLCTGKLLRYAKRIGACVVAIGTQARSSLSRWFAGSFAETLMNESRLPLLVAGPRSRPRLKSPRAIIVPTDFDSGARDAFLKILELASARDLVIHLFHRAPHSIGGWPTAGDHLLGGEWISVEALFGEDEDGVATEARQWMTTATERDVDLRFASESFHDSTTDAILEYAKKLDAASPLIATLLPARLTRDLIRTSPYPIYLAGHGR